MLPNSKFPGSMTARQFDKAAKQMSMSPVMLASARRVLVDGDRVQDVVDSDGVTSTNIYRAMYKVELQLGARRTRFR